MTLSTAAFSRRFAGGTKTQIRAGQDRQEVPTEANMRASVPRIDTTKAFSYPTLLPWLGLAGILLLYITFIGHLHPVNLFGATQDDPIYFSSAKALAEGKGYILPSLPGEPQAANKFPVLYPWMLSWIWRLNPSFPANVNDGVGLTVAFGLVYLSVAFRFFRRAMKLGDAEALLLTLFCAFHPVILVHSASILSDIPFAALCFGSLLLADMAIQQNGTRAQVVVCGVLVGFSLLMRTTGFPIVAGILAIAILRKAWRQAAMFSSTVAVFLAFFLWEKLSAAKASLPAGWSTLGPGFRQTWLFYTDYVGFRKLSAPNLSVTGELLLAQFLYLWRQLPAYFLSSSYDRSIPLLAILLCLMSVSFVRTIKRDGWKPIHAALIFYLAMVLGWNYPDWDRFLIPFLPLFVASLWVEAKWIAGEVSREIRSDGRRGDRVTAVLIGFVLATLAIFLALMFVSNSDRRNLLAFCRARSELLIEKKQAYDWLRRNSPGDARIIAGENASLYLYTGRQSMGPIVMLPAGIYEPTQMQSDLIHITDVASAIRATYWLGSVDDGDTQLQGYKTALTTRLHQIESVLPEVFHSTSGNVRIYRLDCLQNQQDISCRWADHVLFPAEHPSARARHAEGTIGVD
jgi:hypothetical protein